MSLIWVYILPNFIRNLCIFFVIKLNYNNVRIGLRDTCRIDINGLLSGNISLGEFASIDDNIIVSPYVSLGAYSSISWPPWELQASQKYPIRIWKYCSIARNVFILSHNYHNSQLLTTYILPWQVTDNHWWSVIIGNWVWIGANVTVLPWVTIGDGAIIWAWSIVTKSVLPYAIIAGNPAKLIRFRFSEDDILKIEWLQWAQWPVEKILNNIDYPQSL